MAISRENIVRKCMGIPMRYIYGGHDIRSYLPDWQQEICPSIQDIMRDGYIKYNIRFGK